MHANHSSSLASCVTPTYRSEGGKSQDDSIARNKGWVWCSILTFAVVSGHQCWFCTTELSQSGVNQMGWNATFSGQDRPSLSSDWEQHPQKGSGQSLCCSQSVTAGDRHSTAEVLGTDGWSCIQQALHRTKGSRGWTGACRAHVSRCVSLAWRWCRAEALPFALSKCPWNTRVQSPVTGT